MKSISLGLINNRHNMPVDGYVLELVEDVTNVDAIHDAVYESLWNKLGKHIYVSYSHPINSDDYTDVLTRLCDVELHLYVTGLTSAALAVAGFCAENGVPLVAYHYDRDTGAYIPQRVFDAEEARHDY